MADHPYGGPPHLPHPADRGTGEPDRLGRRDLRGVGARRAHLHDPGRRLLGRRRGRRSMALAPCALGHRAVDGRRLASHDAGHRRARRAAVRTLDGDHMKHQHWFLPETPDVLGLLRRQLAVTIEGGEAFAAWTAGDRAAAQRVRDTEPLGDVAKRELLHALRDAFVTPLEPEDLFALSSGIDRVLDYTSDLVGESEAMDCRPDGGIAEMAARLAEGLRHLDDAIAKLGSDGDGATADADLPIACPRALDQAYSRGVAALLEVRDMRVRIARRELYRRCARIGETLADLAERVIYA